MSKNTPLIAQSNQSNGKIQNLTTKETNLQTQTLQVGVSGQRSAQHRTSNTVEINSLFHLFLISILLLRD